MGAPPRIIQVITSQERGDPPIHRVFLLVVSSIEFEISLKSAHTIRSPYPCLSSFDNVQQELFLLRVKRAQIQYGYTVIIELSSQIYVSAFQVTLQEFLGKTGTATIAPLCFFSAFTRNMSGKA